MKLTVDRAPHANLVDGGHAIPGEVAFKAPFVVAAVRLTVGFETAWLTRDEAHELAALLMGAASDA